jgi:hypothetical protein
MSDRDQVTTLTANTSADEVVLEMHGEYNVSIQGDIGGGTLTHYIHNTEGRGGVARADTTAPYLSKVQESEFVLTGSTAPDLDIILTPVTVNQD